MMTITGLWQALQNLIRRVERLERFASVQKPISSKTSICLQTTPVVDLSTGRTAYLSDFFSVQEYTSPFTDLPRNVIVMNAAFPSWFAQIGPEMADWTGAMAFGWDNNGMVNNRPNNWRVAPLNIVYGPYGDRFVSGYDTLPEPTPEVQA